MFFFCCLGGARAPAQTAKKITPEKLKQQKRPDNKNINTLTPRLLGNRYMQRERLPETDGFDLFKCTLVGEGLGFRISGSVIWGIT